MICVLVEVYITNIAPCQAEWKEGQGNAPSGIISPKQSSEKMQLLCLKAALPLASTAGAGLSSLKAEKQPPAASGKEAALLHNPKA